MKKHKKIFKESLPGIRWWISPDGEIVQVPKGLSHGETAAGVIGREFKSNDLFLAVNELLEKGWVDIINHNENLYIRKPMLKMTREQQRSIKKLAIKNNLTIVEDLEMKRI